MAVGGVLVEVVAAGGVAGGAGGVVGVYSGHFSRWGCRVVVLVHHHEYLELDVLGTG